MFDSPAQLPPCPAHAGGVHQRWGDPQGFQTKCGPPMGHHCVQWSFSDLQQVLGVLFPGV